MQFKFKKYLKTLATAERRKGVTLIETLLYAALMALTVGAVIYSVTTLVLASQDLNDRIAVEEEANFILKKIEWALTGYNSIASPAAGESGSSISINKYGFGSNPIVFDLDADLIRIKEGTGNVIPLNSDKVDVNTLSFTHIAETGTGPAGVRANINIGGRDYKFVIYKKQ